MNPGREREKGGYRLDDIEGLIGEYVERDEIAAVTQMVAVSNSVWT